MHEPVTGAFTTGDATMVFTDQGEPGRTTFLLVHGIGMGRTVFAGLAAELGRHGRVLSVDLPGFGDSPKPKTARSIAVLGDLIAAFLRSEGVDQAVLVGHSMGAQVVAETAARHPSLCESLVLIGPTVNNTERSALKQALRLTQDLVGERPNVLALGATQYLKAGPIWFIAKLRTMVRHRIEDVLPLVLAPALVLRGETDKVCPRDWAVFLSKTLQRGRLREVPERGHEAMIANPDPAAALILDFVARESR